MSLAYADFDIRIVRRPLPELSDMSFVQTTRKTFDPAAIAVIDAKSLYDAFNSEQTMQEDRRAALEIVVIRDDFAILNGRIRWIPHSLNPADAIDVS